MTCTATFGECVLDWYDFYPGYPVTDLQGGAEGLHRIIRGGSRGQGPISAGQVSRPRQHAGRYQRLPRSRGRMSTIQLSIRRFPRAPQSDRRGEQRHGA